MIIRESDGSVCLSIKGGGKPLKIECECISRALYLAESLGCECYAVKSDLTICASIPRDVGNPYRVFKIIEYKKKCPEIFFNTGYLGDELIKKYSGVAKCTYTNRSGADGMFKLVGLPPEVIVKFCEPSIKVIKERIRKEQEKREEKRKRRKRS